MSLKIKIVENKSKTYFLPLFAEHVRIEYFSSLVNTYFWYDEDISEETFCLLFKFDGSLKGNLYNRRGFTVYEHYLCNHELFLGSMDYNRYVIYSFKLPLELIEARNKMIEGKFSHLTKSEKNNIIDYTLLHYDIAGATKLRKILNRDPNLRLKLAEELGYTDSTFPKDAELTSPITISKEIFQNSLIKNKNSEKWT